MKIEKYLGVAMTIFAILFNLWLYRLEPTAKIDPNDNPFQYALVDRTNQMWDYAWQKCKINPLCFSGYLIDHWVPNWAQGYNLPYYYSHVPQIAIVASYRLAIQPLSHLSLFTWYHIVIYLLLCIFPLSLFLALRVIRLPWIIAGAGALFASHISTDGLYGLDPSSFLWRGFGLTSQLFAMIWIPLAIAYGYRWLYTEEKLTYKLPSLRQQILHSKLFWKAVLFLVLTISGHLGLGVLTLLSLGMLAISKPILGVLQQESIYTIIDETKQQLFKLALVAGTAIFFLSYWVIPALKNDAYHNYSFWDPVWKFNSWGWREVMQYFFNGALFDFGRGFPILTVLIIIGGFAAIMTGKKQRIKESPYYPFALLFFFWMLMFFGRTTWGSLLDIIPSMKEFHQSRFIVGVHVAGFFLVPLGLWFLTDQLPQILMKIKDIFNNGMSVLKQSPQYSISPQILILCSLSLTVLTVFLAYPQTMRYSEFNDVLIKRGNENFDKQNPDVEKLINLLKESTPGRTFTGRGGSWGKELQIAETTYFIHLSTYGIPVILWLPETWSPNSDVEQFFIEDWQEHYDLLNVRYIVTPPTIEPKSFWKLKAESPVWKLYETPTSGYFGTGSHAAIVYSSKFHYINLVRQWIQSDYVKNKLFPELTYSRSKMMSTLLPAFEMVDEASYMTRDGKSYGLFGEIPKYEAPTGNITTGAETVLADMEFKTTVNVEGNCDRCLVFLKQSFHPNWKAYVDGKRAETFTSFPFYIAVALPYPGDHTVEFKYEPDTLKLLLFTLAFAAGIVLIAYKIKSVKTSS